MVFAKGAPSWNKGLRGVSSHTKETKEKIRQGMIGKSSKWLTGKKQSEESRKKKSEALKGNRSHLWVDGRSYSISHVNAVKLKNKIKRQETKAGRKKPESCDLCGDKVKICFDHDHITGKFRGWLCHGCNLSIAFAKDSPELLIKMSVYLKKPHA